MAFTNFGLFKLKFGELITLNTNVFKYADEIDKLIQAAHVKYENFIKEFIHVSIERWINYNYSEYELDTHNMCLSSKLDGLRNLALKNKKWSLGENDDLVEKIIYDINDERYRQDVKFGIQNHDPMTWCVILTEEVGEVSKAALELNFNSKLEVSCQQKIKQYREEMIQVAAVAMAAVECLDGNFTTD